MKKTKFKDTEIGLIPEDWALCILGNKSLIQRGGSPRPINAFLTNNQDGANWIKIGDVKIDDKYINKTAEKIIPSGVIHSRKVYKGDFILSNSMSFGRPYILNIDGCIHDGWLVIQNYKETFDKDYLYYFLGSSYVYSQYISMAAGSSVQNLNKDKVAGVQVAYPLDKSEQQRIASVLSNVDLLITKLDKLIEKKKAIKQGAMQQLLTGKRRLPGFTKPWESVPFEDICLVKKGKQVNGELLNDAGRYPMLNGGINPSGYLEEYNTQSDTITISEGGNSCGFVSYMSEKFWAGGHCYIVNPVLKLNIKYLYYLLKSLELQIMSLRVGSGLPNVQSKSLYEMSLLFVNDEAEQSAIAKILTSMDNEISVLESKMEKYKQIKQGMMQQLLTGKIRLLG